MAKEVKKTKLETLTSFGGEGFSFQRGKIVEVIAETANDWIKHGLAKEVK